VETRRSYPIKTFDPLLRDLVAFGLVQRGDGAGGAWQLSAAVQRRLDELANPTGAPAPERLVYLDHRCASCRRRGVTRLFEGAYLCDACLQERRSPPSAPPLAEALPAPSPEPALVPAPRRSPWRRQEKAAAGDGSIAG